MLSSAPPLRAGADPLPLREFLAIVSVFWLAVALSAVLYAYGMDVTFQRESGKSVFASWDARVLQYLLLFAPLLLCYRLSLRLGWQPGAARWPLQLALGALFALLARPALWLAISVSCGECDDDHDEMINVMAWIGPELPMWLASFSEFLVRYGFGLALVTGFALYKDYRDSQLRVTALEQQWNAARLSALRLQLSPHTLFNLLHTIRGQIAWDPPAAQAMVVQLSDLLRKLLNAGAREFTPLPEELQFVRLYLELQSRRFSDRLSFELPELSALPALWVPSLILQPLVENAVAHGMAGHSGMVRVRVEVERLGDRLRLRVRNEVAAGRAPGAAGVGLGNVRERLLVQFGAEATLSAGLDGDEWLATVDLPALDATP